MPHSLVWDCLSVVRLIGVPLPAVQFHWMEEGRDREEGRIAKFLGKPLIFSFLAVLSSPLGCVVTPLHVNCFAQQLVRHPNQMFVQYVLSGIQNGFHIGFNHNQRLKSSKGNQQSALQYPTVIDGYLSNELIRNRVAGPFKESPFLDLHVSSFGVIPKSGQPGKWRLIVDLSSPRGFSVNDGIDPKEFTMQYVTMDRIIQMVCQLGIGALIAKFDVEAAYRNVPVHPEDRYLLGMKWRDMYYVDLVLPFGLRSAPFIFNSIAVAVEWILCHNYGLATLVHYLDDFILAGPPNSLQCSSALQTAMQVCSELGLPLNPNKCVGPSTTMVVLGIELDSINQTASLPNQKLAEVMALVSSWQGKQVCKRKELESLIGHLQHASKVVWPGRAFVRRMLDLLKHFRKPHHHIRLNVEFKLDLEWWEKFLQHWNGVSFWLFPGMHATPGVNIVSDASGSVGFGALYNNSWFNGTWAPQQFPLSIAYKELFPIVIAAHVWGPQ